MSVNVPTPDLFYGSVLEKGSREPLADQVYAALVREIAAGRWSVGERLPSYTELCERSGLSRTPIGAALRRLERDDYIKTVKQKGIFLKSRFPGNHVDLGTIALLVESSPGQEGSSGVSVTQAFGLWDTDKIQEMAAESGINITKLPVNGSPRETVGKLRSMAARPGFLGILSMLPPRRLKGLSIKSGTPLVYLGIEDPTCAPCITGNPYMAVVLLAEYLIKRGHSKIALFAAGGMPSFFSESVASGYRRALQDSSLKPQEEALAFATGIEHLDVAAVRRFLEMAENCTAVIGATSEISRKVIETADAFGIAVPDDLSVCSMLGHRMRSDMNERLVGINYHWIEIVKACFNALLNFEEHAETSRIVFAPRVIDGRAKSVKRIGGGKQRAGTESTGHAVQQVCH